MICGICQENKYKQLDIYILPINLFHSVGPLIHVCVECAKDYEKLISKEPVLPTKEYVNILHQLIEKKKKFKNQGRK